MKTNFSFVRTWSAAALLLAAACSRSTAPQVQPAATAGTPAQAVEAVLAQLHEHEQFDGAVLVAEQGRVTLQQAAGWANQARREALRPDAQFDVSALSQTFTAAAVLALRDQQELHLDDELSRYVPNLPYPGVTLRHLLTHTSGIPEVDVRESGNDVAAELYYLHPEAAFAPGRRWEYTTTNYALLQKVVERVSGLAFADYLQRSFFGPLNMRDTRATAQAQVAPERRAVGYARPTYLRPATPAAAVVPGLHIYSTLTDLHTWMRGLRNGQFLTAASVAELFAPTRLADGSWASTTLRGRAAGFGMGWFTSLPASGQSMVWHSGGQDGYFAYLGFDAAADRVVILLNNTADAAGTLATATVVEQVLGGRPALLPKRSVARAVGRLVAAQGIEAAVLHYASVHTDTARYYASEFEFEQLSQELQARQRPAEALAVLTAYAATAPAADGLREPLLRLHTRLVVARTAAWAQAPAVVAL
ncbi:beta-lactamase family protein [Hymenobacter busanensis]|uniref:Beta-lactamase family protein n=1 Tax=Hymenobacter busanensis TaxID=2607656 RepID=A0A7L4ZWY2_9BACT|nr:serine hydrolase domain-containing protein [Hymenobacter busanensis]KAA9333317.1 beta-lactamase family protein [Hymenobacter busanensis]QHJ08004.1 serine hydrolase [Hymenobacter busanensis]